MAERYNRLFSLQENLYSSGSPVVILAGSLLKDTKKNTVLGQLKLKNISAKTIKAAKVKLFPLDTVNKPLDGETAFEYLDLDIARDEEFGQKAAIPLPDLSTRAFAVEVTEVDFADNSVWNSAGEAWEPLPKLENIDEAELEKQYKLHFGDKAQYKPIRLKGAWLCACGAINNESEDSCHICANRITELIACDFNALADERDRRLAKEKAEREAKAAAEKAAAEKKAAEEKAAAEKKAIAEKEAAKKRKRTCIIVFSAVAVCVAALLLISNVIVPNSTYNKARKLLEAGQYEEAITAFEALDGFKDSAEQAAEAEAAKAEAETAAVYEKAEALLAAGDYDGAIAEFQKLGNYRDSAERLEAAEAAKAEAETAAAYEKAEALLAAGDYDGAIAEFQKLGNYRDSAERLEAVEAAKKEAAYLEAKRLAEEGQNAMAFIAFQALNGYKDSAAQIHSILSSYGLDGLLDASVGDIITFGSFEQDNNTANGGEEIEWLVLAKEDDRLLVISRYALLSRQYHNRMSGITWESCALRDWLNKDFLSIAFSDIEQILIPSTTVTADEGNDQMTSSGNETEDKVFLLSTLELAQYFDSDESAQCAATPYAIASGAYTYGNDINTGDPACMWWLRTPGHKNQDYACFVGAGGAYMASGGVTRSDICVRPAMWIDLG